MVVFVSREFKVAIKRINLAVLNQQDTVEIPANNETRMFIFCLLKLGLIR